MKNKVNPFVGIGIIALVAVLIVAFLYQRSFRPSEGSMQSLPADEKAKIMSHYGHFGSQARPPSNGVSNPASAAETKNPTSGSR